MRLCSHSQNIKREYEGLPELHHYELESVGNVSSFSSEALLPHKLLSFTFIDPTKEKTIRKRDEKKSHSNQRSSTKQIAHQVCNHIVEKVRCGQDTNEWDKLWWMAHNSGKFNVNSAW
ncbi:hypothetical protein KY284_001136 [Solanum tuberosum]|nr:hypothetical protein KY284_001136 [Solanum tuberosum]